MHAYLILAHNEFEILQLLIHAIDDVRNDIYIHFDKKVEKLPELNVKYSRLHILSNRVDVRWADVSMVAAEYNLFETASANGDYDYYHLLSGVDLPLKSQDEIHRFFSTNNGKEFIGYYQGNISERLKRRVNYYHLYPKYFRETSGLKNRTRRGIRKLFVLFQQIFGLRRNKNTVFKKGTQWISVTQDFVKELLSQKHSVLKMYQYSFCSDEIFVQTLCWNTSFRDKLYDAHNEGRGCVRCIGWQDNELPPFTIADLDTLLKSDAMFARKFSGKHLDVVKKIVERVVIETENL